MLVAGPIPSHFSLVSYHNPNNVFRLLHVEDQLGFVRFRLEGLYF